MFFCIFLCDFLFDSPFISSHISFISDQYDPSMLISIVFDFFEPPLDILKRLRVRYIKSQNSDNRTISYDYVLFVVRSNDRFETFLTCGIPYHGLDCCAADLKCFRTELNA